MRSIVLGAVAVVGASCATAPAVSPSVRLRPETRPECVANCEQLGLRLAAIVLIRDSAGCVCEPREAPAGSTADARGAAAIAAGAAIAVDEDEQQRRERQEEDARRRRMGETPIQVGPSPFVGPLPHP